MKPGPDRPKPCGGSSSLPGWWRNSRFPSLPHSTLTGMGETGETSERQGDLPVSSRSHSPIKGRVGGVSSQSSLVSQG
jgi:hypothetical protein